MDYSMVGGPFVLVGHDVRGQLTALHESGATDTLNAVTTDEGGPAYSVDIDIGATSEQTAAIQRLFDDIGLEATVSATYTVKSPVVVAVMYLIGSGAAAAFLKAAAKFGENLGGELGTYAGQRVKNWLERAREARNEEFVVVIRDPSLTAEVVVTGYEPAEAIEQLMDLLEHDQITAIPGKAAEVRYQEGEGWVRPF